MSEPTQPTAPSTLLEEASPLRLLACGRLPCNDPLDDVLAHTGFVVDSLWSEALSLGTTEQRIRVFGPLIGRSLLETVLSGVLARLDPFRVLLVREIQRGGQYPLHLRHRTSIQWTGDMIPDKKLSGLTPENWPADKSVDQFSRALFGEYFDYTVWRPAFKHFVDARPVAAVGPWVDALVKLDPDTFTGYFRGNANGAFSVLSKGIHHEFVISPANLFDSNTVRTWLAEAVRIAATVSAVSHGVGFAACKLPATAAWDLLIELQEMESALCPPSTTTN